MNNKWLISILLISAALNLLFVGAYFGRSIGQDKWVRPFPPHLGWIVRQLDPETRQALLPELEDFAKQDRELRQSLLESQRSVNAMLLRDPLDRSAIEDQLENLRGASMESQQALHQAMIEIMVRLDLDQRRKTLGALRRNWPDEFRHRRHRPGAPKRPDSNDTR